MMFVIKCQKTLFNFLFRKIMLQHPEIQIQILNWVQYTHFRHIKYFGKIFSLWLSYYAVIFYSVHSLLFDIQMKIHTVIRIISVKKSNANRVHVMSNQSYFYFIYLLLERERNRYDYVSLEGHSILVHDRCVVLATLVK